MGRVLFATVGSWGDLFPMIGTALELQERGHEVEIAASPAWGEVVTGAGVRFSPSGRNIGFDEFAAHPEIFGPMPLGLRAALGRFVFDQIEQLSDDLREPIARADLVVSHPAQVAALNIAEAQRVPAAVATVFPAMLPSAHTVPPGTPRGPWSGPAGRLLNRSLWGVSRLATAALFDRPVNAHRRTLGLRPVRAALLRMSHRTEGVVVLADPAVVVPAPDWHDRIHIASFVGWDRFVQEVPDDVRNFLEAGDPPVLVTLGASSAVAADDFFDQATRELTARGARVLNVTGPARAPTDADPGRVLTVDYLPFSPVLPACRAAIHHAGIGTTVSVLQAGIPQVAVPMGFDQPETARLVEALGVGVRVPWKRRRRRLGPAIERVLGDTTMAEAASRLRATLGRRDGAELAADAIEGMLAARPPR